MQICVSICNINLYICINMSCRCVDYILRIFRCDAYLGGTQVDVNMRGCLNVFILLRKVLFYSIDQLCLSFKIKIKMISFNLSDFGS